MKIRFALALIVASLSSPLFAAELSPDTILVKRGDIVVTAADFYAYLDKLPENQRDYFRGDLERITNAVSQIYLFRVLAAEARAQGIDKEPDMKQRMALMQETVLAQAYMSRFDKAIVTPDFTGVAREMYKANPEKYKAPETLRARQIIVGLQGRSDEEARKRAEQAQARLLKGEPFTGNIVREFSTDSRFKINDGLIDGPYKLLPPEVEAIAKTIPLNQVSAPIKADDGYHVIMVEERVPAHVIPFEKVKDSLVEAEQKKFKHGAVEDKLATITKSKDIVLYTDQIAALQVEPDRAKLQEMHNEKLREETAAKKKLIEEAAKATPSK